MDLAQRKNDFIQYLRFEKRYSAHTIAAYELDLRQFQQYLEEEYESLQLSDLSHFHIRSWLAALKDQQDKERTINRKISTLNSFFKFLLRAAAIQGNPVSQLHALRLPERLPAYLKEDETHILLDVLDFEEGFKGFTDRMICELLYQTGMRRGELAGLKEADIEWSLKQIRIFGKGNKERLVPVSNDLLNRMKQYLEDKSNINNADKNHFLVLESGQPLYVEYIYKTVKKYLSMATTLKKKSPHVLRHTFATHLLNNGANIQAIKDLLGHSSLASTQVYTHNNIEKLKEIHQLNHPRG